MQIRVVEYRRSQNFGATGWTDERVELLKKLWADGLSTSQIATKLGEVTRNAVIGKVHRLGLGGRATAPRTRAVRQPSLALFPIRRQQCRPKQKTIRFAPAASLLRALPDLGPAPEGLITLASLKKCMCHWPIGDPKVSGFHFCGRRKSSGIPYCEYHAAIAYNFAGRRR